MKKIIENLIGLAVLVLAVYFVAKNLFNINIKNPFAGKSEVPESVVEEMIADTVEELNYDDNVDYTWEITHTPNHELHQDTLDLTLVFGNESGSVTYQKVQTYQYYKENDIWEVCEYGDADITDMQWNLEEMIDGKTFHEDDSYGSFTVTFSDLDMQTQTVTAAYSYVYYDTQDEYYGEGAWGNKDYYITDLDGKQVNELNGTVRCNIEGDETSFFRIEEVIGYQYCVSDMYIVGYGKTGNVVFQLIYRWPTEFSEPSVGLDRGW